MLEKQVAEEEYEETLHVVTIMKLASTRPRCSPSLKRLFCFSIQLTHRTLKLGPH